MQPAAISRSAAPATEFVVRAALCVVAVVLCYQFSWSWLRALTATLNVALDSLVGVRLERVAPDLVLWKGQLYRYVIACTMADVWCGALPLLWNARRPVAWNLARSLLFGAAVIVFNIFRLSLSDVLFAWGVNWDLAHGVIAGLAYFAIWVWIWNHRTWRDTASESTLP